MNLTPFCFFPFTFQLTKRKLCLRTVANYYLIPPIYDFGENLAFYLSYDLIKLHVIKPCTKYHSLIMPIQLII